MQPYATNNNQQLQWFNDATDLSKDKMTGVHLSDRHTLGHVVEGDADAIAHFARQPPWPLCVTNIKRANQLL